MNKIPFAEAFKFEKKSMRKAGDGKDKADYPFYSSSNIQNKYIDYPDYDGPALIIGTGGKACVHYNEGSFSTSGDCLVAKPKHRRVDTKAIYYFLSSNIHLLEAGFKGAGLRHVSKGYISELLIPKIPMIKQKRIAAILDKADAIRKKRQAAIKLAEDFLRAFFLDMFGDPVTNPKGWETAFLRDFGLVTTGNTPSRKIAKFYGNDIEWIKSDNINTPYYFLTKAEEGLSEEGKQVARTVPQYSTLVTCIAGSFDCIGNAALTDREVAFNQQINAITPKEDTDPFFLYCLILNSKKMIQNASTNSMKGMVSKGKFQQIVFYKPPTSLQQEFGSFFRKHIESVNNFVDSERLSADLFSSLTQRAFRGEL